MRSGNKTNSTSGWYNGGEASERLHIDGIVYVTGYAVVRTHDVHLRIK